MCLKSHSMRDTEGSRELGDGTRGKVMIGLDS